MNLLLKSDWSIVLIMTGAVKQIVEEGRILVTVHHIFSTNNGMQNLISALKTSQPNGSTAWRVEDGVLGGAGDGRNTGEPQSTKHHCSLQIETLYLKGPML